MSDVLKQRKTLEKQIAAAWNEYSAATRQRQDAEVELNRATRALEHMTKLRASSRSTDKEVATAERRLQQAQAEQDLWHQRTNAALDAAKALEHERDQLLAQHPSEFADEAERVTDQAVGALGRAADAIRDAQEAWQAAEAAWLPLCRALHLEGVPPCPLPEPEQLMEVVPRPRSVVLTE